MRNNRKLRLAAAVVSLALASGSVHALDVTATAQPLPIGSEVVAANVLEGSLSGTGSLSQISGSISARSPWTGLTGPAQAAESDREFLYVQVGSITFDLADAFGGLPVESATLLWGSPDSQNTLELVRDGEVVATIVPGQPDAGVPVDRERTYLVNISGVVFDTLVFRSTRASFEFANLAVIEFDRLLACGDTEVEGGSTLRRLNDVGVAEAINCSDPIPSRLEFDGQTLAFLADYSVLEEGAEPAFAFDVAWRTEWVEEAPPPGAIPFLVGGPNPPATPTAAQAAPFSVQWFGLSRAPDDPHLLDFCPGQAAWVTDAEGNQLLAALDFPADFDATAGGENDMSDLPGFQFGCLVSRDVEVVEDSQCPVESRPPTTPDADPFCVLVKESGYLRGDWTATRTLR